MSPRIRHILVNSDILPALERRRASFLPPLTLSLSLHDCSLAGFCCNQYKPCPEDSDAFTLDTKEADPKAYTEENCEGDYVRIEGGSNTCQRIPTFTVNKYCGTLFSSTNEAEGAQDVVCGKRKELIKGETPLHNTNAFNF